MPIWHTINKSARHEKGALRPQWSFEVSQRALKVNVQIADVVSEVVIEPFMRVGLLGRHQGFKRGSNLQSTCKAFLCGHWLAVEVQGSLPHLLWHTRGGVSTQEAQLLSNWR